MKLKVVTVYSNIDEQFLTDFVSRAPPELVGTVADMMAKGTSSWSSKDLDALGRAGSKVLVCSNLGVKKEFRGDLGLELSIKQTFMYLLVHFLVDSDCDVLAGTTRCDRGVNKAVYTSGGVFINRSEMHGVSVDLIGYFKENILRKRAEYSHAISDALWEKRMDLTIQKSKPNFLKAA